ncbi:leucine-rich repeat-containing G-protein coupled receptor 4 [Tribolium castaneum]|nr:PREDICTED: leucine-rich repeat-containing G-protein coupled receptor 4-like [Tribolium castaneum]|eukprot:XP_015838255.1 PREDICTED: leucine-rich repeat-containing G-protein coupled receptor 4-like [Tribolium castaneum]
MKFYILLTVVTTVWAKCRLQVAEGMPNRTLCTVETLEEDSLKLKNQKNADFLYVDVSHGEIPKDAFAKLKSRKELWFLGENITYIQPGAFAGLTELDNLAVTNTLITNVSRNSFSGVPNLKVLSLIKNKIEFIEDGAFSGLGGLQQLLLNENRLRRINETTFHGLEHLQALYLDDNPIEYIHVNALRKMTNLTRLVISFVKDKTVDEAALDFIDDNRKIVHYVKL